METSQTPSEDIVLYRVIPGRCVHGEHISSEAFIPLRSENKLLSVSDSSKIPPEQLLARYAIDGKKERPAGVLCILLSECRKVGLKVNPDPHPFADHMLINFGEFGSKKTKKIASFLRDRALARGWVSKP